MIGTVNFYGMLSGLGDTIQNNAKPPWSVTTAPDLRRRPLSGHGLAFGDNAEVSQALAARVAARGAADMALVVLLTTYCSLWATEDRISEVLTIRAEG